MDYCYWKGGQWKSDPGLGVAGVLDGQITLIAVVEGDAIRGGRVELALWT